MKIWNSFGSEHSMNLRMIGRFKTERDAIKVEEMIAQIADQLRRDATDLSSEDTRRFSEGMLSLLGEIDMYSVGAEELEQLLYEAHVTRHGSEIRVETEEADVSAYLKLLVFMGGRVEVFSAHDYPTGENGTTSDGKSDGAS